ncbi:HdeD family acid-resistance protein [Albimonas sp. CAU 1670]|uniref:HdeD family acid-resistance protein n=1 Tax=Albimonas sp. CAU 1670 TaxID=3032599 RepID=UPI0023DB52D6|nr:HdeD family acid-resistance protein [Albimonas sp. CAU 1670]MDF2235406.1 HdeD family acid-resistance protein [Albimonas sp. CAU 1670]
MTPQTQVPFPMPDVLVRNWKWLVGIGLLLIVMGVFAILAPFLASVAINAWIGVAFLLAGIAQVAQSFGKGGWREAIGHLLIGAVYIIGALLVIFDPLAGLMAFSLVIVLMLAISGAVRIVEGLRMRPAQGWGWMTAAGVAAVIMALVIYASFPGSALWLLGLLAGIAFVSDGSALLALGLAARKAEKA